MPSILTDGEKKHIIGVQANLWTEYIPTFSQVEYMLMPRIAALAEVQWTDPSKKEYQSFLSRLARMTNLYDRLGYNYARHIFDVQATLTPNFEKGYLEVTFSTLGDGTIYYTLDGTEPSVNSNKYDTPLELKENATIKAIVIRPNGKNSRVFSEEIKFNKATLKPITLKDTPTSGYTFDGAPTLVDGIKGSENYKTGRWLGFQGKYVDATIDLMKPTEIRKISFNTNVVKGDWIMGACNASVKVSNDGVNFREVTSKNIQELSQMDKDGIYTNELTFDPVTARYVEVIINGCALPSWHTGVGNPAFLFVDEIEVL